MKKHLKIHIYPFILLLLSTWLLSSCNEEDMTSFEVPDATHTCKMTLNADFTGFDAKDVTSRASIHGWDDGDIVYLSFSTSDNNHVGGNAIYDAAHDDWTVTYTGTLSPIEDGNVIVHFFDGEVSGSTALAIDPTVGIYADLSGSYKYSADEEIHVTANLSPRTSRIRFKGTPRDSITISGIDSYTSYDCQSGTMITTAASTPLSIASDGYTPYIYGVFADASKPSICVNNEGCNFTKDCSAKVFQIGESGWMDVPTRSAHDNWKMDDLCEAHIVLSDSDNDRVRETLVFYYDEVDHSQEGIVYNLNNGRTYPDWHENNPNITSVIFDSSFAFARPTSTFGWFNECSNLKSISGIRYLDTSNVRQMSFMFWVCSSLTSLDVSNFNTSNVTDMSCMFLGCSGLTSLDVSNFDTSHVTELWGMFSSCSSLTTLDVSNFDTSNVTNMSSMFSGCSSLTTLDVSNFDTSNVTNMSSMFSACSSLNVLDVSNLNTSKVTDMGWMFSHCTTLAELDLSNFDTSNVTNMNGMFYLSKGLTKLNISNFDTSKVTDMRQMFRECSSLTYVDVRNFNTSNVTDMMCMFVGCSSLKALEIDNFDTSNVTSMQSMFGGCSSLLSLNVSNFDTSKVTDMKAMFSSCSSLFNLIVNNFDTSNVTDMRAMFSSCSNLTELNLSSFDTSNVTNMSYMFNQCSGLTDIDISNFKISYGTDIGVMFHWCTNLSSINLGDNDFTGCIDDGNDVFSKVGSPSVPCNLIINTDFDTSVLGSLYGNYYHWRGGYFSEPTYLPVSD